MDEFRGFTTMTSLVELACDEKKTPEGEGRYLYCIVEIGRKKIFRKFGIDEEDVYIIPYRGIGAVVHRCPSKPYQSGDQELVKKWLLQHQKVVDFFFERYDVVLPFAFDNIIKGSNADTDEKVMSWLKQEYQSLKKKTEKIRGKQEFGVQIFWDSKSVAEEVTNESVEAKKILNEIKFRPRGLAYMYTQKLKEVMKRELEDKAERYFKEFYEDIRSHVNDVRIEKIPKVEGDKQMIMSLSCLTSKDRVQELGRELDKINNTPHFSVKFTGPWPVYSFMT